MPAFSLRVATSVHRSSETDSKSTQEVTDTTHIYNHMHPLLDWRVRAQELCESRGGRPGLPSLISLRFLWT